MDNFNKIVSFVLGLVVVIVFLAVITGRFNLKNTIMGLGGKARVTPTVALTPFISPTGFPDALGQINTSANNFAPKTPNSIPATGSPSLILPLIFSTLSLGIYLKRKK